jgi:flagellum-specific peptidoglycan hydrolase FlgJ
MIKKFLLGCNSSKPVVRTSKATPQRTKKEVVRKVRKPVAKPATKPQGGTARTSEVIESTSKTVVYSDVVQGYVMEYKNIAMGNMKTYGIPASIILAQGILESGAGRGHLASTANNHFGIKCHTGWTGPSVRHDDDSDQECFRKYSDAAESYKDHAIFLTGRSRYAALFKLEKDDYEGWARGLRAAGYATDPKYPEKLISYIERYNLHQYDAQVLGRNYVPVEQPAKSTQIAATGLGTYEVQQGDTLYSISKKFSLTVEDLKSKNNLADNTISIGQRLIVK